MALRDEWPPRTGLAEIFDAGLEGETPWLALPHLSTPTLDMRLRETRTTPAISLEDALALIRGLAAALDAAHLRGIVHGSLHPRDVFIGAGGLARVTGFGLAAVLARSGIRVPARRPYSAPETLEGAAVTPAADLFALGALAFELLTGRRPAGLGAAAAAHLELPASEEAVAHVRTIVAAMLAEQPGHRPGSAVAFAQALAQALPHVRTSSPRVGFADLEEAAELGNAPSDDALRLFATQGTLWEASRRVEPWSEAAGAREAPVAPGVGAGADTEDLEAAIDAARLRGPQPADAAPDPTAHAAARDDETTAIYARAPTAGNSGSMLGLGGPSGAPPDRIQLDDAEGPDEPRYAPADEPSHGRGAHLEDPARDPSSPPAVVLALTLALGLAIGGAGGFLIGQRGANRDRVAPPLVSDETRSTADTADPASAASPRNEPSAIDETALPDAASASRAGGAPARAGSAATGSGPAGPSPAAPVRRRAVTVTGEIIVRSTPAGAGVVVNSTWRGRTPLTLRELPFGTHSVRVVARGYAPETRRISLDARVPAATVAVQLTRTAGPARPAAPAPAKPGATTGSVYIESRPSGARVSIDGRLVGTSPLLILEQVPGAHVIRIDHPGHRSWTTTVAITAGKRQRVAASLEETPGS